MKITLICVGKLKEKFYKEAVAEYAKRLSRYCKLEILEVADETAPEGVSLAQEERILAKEAGRILERLKGDAFVCALEIQGKKMTSRGFADWMEARSLRGNSRLAFVIGGSLGLHPQVRERADFALSFSDMTFPHQLMRVILCEQIYRAFRIQAGEPYHK